MRTTMLLVIALGLAACGGAIDARSDSSSQAFRDAREEAAGRPLVGTLRMRDRDVPLTTAALEARGNEDLVRMTAQSGTPVSADIDDRYVRATGDAPDLTGIQADLF